MEEQNETNQETSDSSAQVGPPTSDTSDKRKRESDLQGEPCTWQPPKRPRDTSPGSNKEKKILSDVKTIMDLVHERLREQDDNELSRFLMSKIRDLEIDKRELVGVFGKSGAGKSSLINTIIGENDLLPCQSINPCTSVMIKVEANTNQTYEADIEFITKEEWRDEYWSYINFLGDNADEEKDPDLEDDERDTSEKMSAVYGKDWRNIPKDKLMEAKYFGKISQEFFNSKKKTLICKTAQELSKELVPYTRCSSGVEEGEEVKKWYWPLVKCVTVKVPCKNLLQHVTLVDLPGNNDCVNSRDKMWKGLVGSCSTVWIVTDMTRPAKEKATWEILKSARSHIGNGGQCQQIHFICTKSDVINDLKVRSADMHQKIMKENMRAKLAVRKKFSTLSEIKRHVTDDRFEVFTVSSREFLQKKHLSAEESEIPRLQEFLQKLNDCHSRTSNYVSGAHGILSLIQGARCGGVADQETDQKTDQKKNARTELEEKLKQELEKVQKPMEEAYKAFEKCLIEGVEESKSSSERLLHSVLYPTKPKGGAFHKILRCVVEHNGTYKPSKRKLIELNVTLASCLTESIDEEFQKTFPNSGKSPQKSGKNDGPFDGVIGTFSLDTERLMEKYKDIKLQLTFLKTEEEKIKTKLNGIIRERKKTIYGSLTKTIEEIMEGCYKKAAAITGEGSLKNMRTTLEEHVQKSKNTMFERAKDVMLKQLKDLKVEIKNILEETMLESIKLSLRTEGYAIPDFGVELGEVQKYLNELKKN